MKKALYFFIAVSINCCAMDGADAGAVQGAIEQYAVALAQLNRALLEAAQDPVLHSHPDGALRRLMEQGAEPKAQDADGMTPLMHLVELSNPAGVKELLDAYSNPHELLTQTTLDGQTALAIAQQGAFGGDSDELVPLLQQYASVSTVKSATKAD